MFRVQMNDFTYCAPVCGWICPLNPKWQCAQFERLMGMIASLGELMIENVRTSSLHKDSGHIMICHISEYTELTLDGNFQCLLTS